MWRRWLYSLLSVLATLRALAADRSPIRARFRDFALRLGFDLPRLDRSICVHREGLGEFNAAAALLARLSEIAPADPLVLTTSRPATVRRLAARFPNAVCLPTPLAHRRFFSRLNPRLLLILEFAEGFSLSSLRLARSRGVP